MAQKHFIKPLNCSYFANNCLLGFFKGFINLSNFLNQGFFCFYNFVPGKR